MRRVGLVLGVHTAGMFALSPLSGWAVDRFGTRLVIFTGLGTLAAWVLLIIAWPSAEGAVMPVALFLLGYGWNLGLVGGSSLLAHEADVPLQMRMQGFVDTVGWGASALGTVGSGVLFAIGDYRHAALGVVRPEAALEAEAMARL